MRIFFHNDKGIWVLSKTNFYQVLIHPGNLVSNYSFTIYSFPGCSVPIYLVPGYFVPNL